MVGAGGLDRTCGGRGKNQANDWTNERMGASRGLTGRRRSKSAAGAIDRRYHRAVFRKGTDLALVAVSVGDKETR